MEKILIVDKDPSILLELSGFLSNTIYEIFTAEDGLECLDILKKEKIDLAIIEIYIEGVYGVDLLNLVRTENISTPILCMTRFGTLELGEEVLKAGAVSLLDKPIKRDLLLAKLQKYTPLQYPSWKTCLEEFLDNNYNNPDLKFGAVMSHFRFSKSYGCALFKQYLGKTFRESLREIRVGRAIALLEEIPLLPISEISDRCGFRSVSRFNEAFKRLHGVSPATYRRSRHA